MVQLGEKKTFRQQHVIHRRKYFNSLTRRDKASADQRNIGGVVMNEHGSYKIYVRTVEKGYTSHIEIMGGEN